MSDGSLSQDEIDALLLGGNVDAPSAGSAGGGSSLSPSEESALISLFQSTSESQSGTLSGMMGSSVSIGSPSVEVVSRDLLQGALSDETVEIKIDFKDGVPGDHLYYFSPADALKLAGPMIGQDDVELNATAISAIGEAISQITGAAVTLIGDKIGKNIMPDSPDGQSIPKAMIRAPQGEMVKVNYKVSIDGGEAFNIIEVFNLSVAKEIASLAGGGDSGGTMSNFDSMGTGASGAMDPMGGMQNGMGQQAMNNPMGGMNMGGMGQQGMNMGQMGGMNMGQMGGMNMGGMMGMGQQPPNVQGVQLPDFGASVSPTEQRNIGLLMDVSMELTVELGRTKWQIKDILGMGEGTIIELDKLAGEPVDILVNHNLIAKGEVVVIDENFGVRVTEIVSSMDRLQKG